MIRTTFRSFGPTVMQTTSESNVPGSSLVMSEIIVEQGWRTRLDHLLARRREAWPLLVSVLLITVVGVVIGGRSAPARVAPPAQPVAEAISSPPSQLVLVHVAGAVRTPGLYEFPVGARVVDAIETAGGPTRSADLGSLNLAAPLQDGTKIEVLKEGEATAPSSGEPAAAEGGPISLNTADQVTLETIPGVGPVTATAIIAYREESGGFDSLEQLLEVDGIGPATFDSIRAYVTL
jgi:competence protein ComEA